MNHDAQIIQLWAELLNTTGDLPLLLDRIGKVYALPAETRRLVERLEDDTSKDAFLKHLADVDLGFSHGLYEPLRALAGSVTPATLVGLQWGADALRKV